MRRGKILRRVTKTAQVSHLTFREMTWKKAAAPDRIVDQVNTLTMYEAINNPEEPWFTDLPHHILPPGQHAKNAVLTAFRDDEAFGYMHILLRKLHKGKSYLHDDAQVFISANEFEMSM